MTRRYDWKLLTNGGIHRLVKGKDFDVDVVGMRKRFQDACSKRGKTAQTEIYGNTIYVQATRETLQTLWKKYNGQEASSKPQS